MQANVIDLTDDPGLLGIGQELMDQAPDLSRVNSFASALPLLSEFFGIAKQKIKDHPQILRFAPAACDSETHQKKILFKIPSPMGRICVEVICFRKEMTVLPHTHPEIVIDEILAGKLREVDFSKQGSTYDTNPACERSIGNLKRTYDPHGSPHSVKALNEDCIALNLTMGTTECQLIELDLIKERAFA